MSEPATIARRIVIAGSVQGVGFRYALADEARRRGLHGWVRNRREGTVEAIIAGNASDVETVIAWAHGGPPSARVSSVDVSDVVEGAYADGEFEITATA